MKYESLDIETIFDKNGIAKALCIAITNNKKIDYEEVKIDEINGDKIITFLLEKCSSKKIYYVHNLTFEIFVFLEKLIEKKVEFKIISANKNIYSTTLKYKKKKIEMRCSYKLTMLSLKNLANLAGEEEKGLFPYNILNENLKEKMIINEKDFKKIEDYEIFIKKYGKNIETYKILKEYCINDAVITKKAIIKFWEIIENMGLKKQNKILTAAKLSITNYFMANKIVKPKISIKIDRTLREGYFGGRTEVFGNPYDDEILLHYDWTGMYSQCMREKVLGGIIYTSNIIKSIETPGFYWIKFEQNLEYPILPIKREKLLFVNGIYEGWYWFEEIKLAVENGVIILEITKMIGGQYYDYFLKDFVEKNEEIRKISLLHKQIGKNNNNTFYGRLGMNPERLSEEIISKNSSIKDYEKITEINNVYLGYKKKEKAISNVTISASITAKARIKLYLGLKEVIKVGGRPCYVDTDSIIAAFKKKDYKNYLDINLGEVYFDSKKNDTIIIDGVFSKPKTYALKFSIKNKDEIVKIKGFNVVPNFKEFKEKFYKKEEIITINETWNKKDFLITKIDQEKKTRLDDLDKREWKENLKETMPIKYPNKRE